MRSGCGFIPRGHVPAPPRQEHLRLARPALARLRPRHHAPRPDPRRGAGPLARLRLHRPVADRALGAQPGVAADQADAAATPTRSPRPTRCYDYRIAADLGGEAALREPPASAPGAHGIRLASDMVPNHMGIDSRWVIEHPDWFLAAADSPYPGYTLRAGRTSPTTRASASTSRTTTTTAPTRRWCSSASTAGPATRASSTTATTAPACPGTTPPSSTTSSAEVREAVIQTILHVARQFPIIRFDAAMTLAKQHFQRLWFPEPGSGGAIPSRAEHGMTQAAVRRRHAHRVLARGGGPGRRRGARTRCCWPRRSG